MFNSILVPVDIAHRSSWEHAVPQALELAAQSGGSVTVVAVVRNVELMFEGVHLPVQLEQILATAKARLVHIVAEYAPAAGSIEQEVRVGSVAREIIAAAKEHGADLILMASHRPEMRDYLIGPNAAHVAQHAPCSVLVLRGPAAAGATSHHS